MNASAAPSTLVQARFDLHCHILPAWDDGPRTLDDSLALAERFAAAGIGHVVATPHVGRSFRGVEHPAETIGEGVSALRCELKQRGIELELGAGAELLLGSVDILAGPVFPPAWTLGGLGKHALVESPFATWPDFGNSLLYETALRGVVPIIAHPERYLDVQRDIAALQPAVAQGALLQITAGSLLGEAGRARQQCAMRLLEAGWVHFVCSDAHGETQALPGEAIATVVNRVGEARARQIFENNPAAVWQGERLPAQVEVDGATRKPSLFQRLLANAR